MLPTHTVRGNDLIPVFLVFLVRDQEHAIRPIALLRGHWAVYYPKGFQMKYLLKHYDSRVRAILLTKSLVLQIPEIQFFSGLSSFPDRS